MNKNYYDILGVNRNCTADELKNKYKKLCLKYHPDRLASKSDKEKKEAENKFKDIQEAYDCLSDTAKRRHYDQFGTMEGFGQGFGGFGGFSGFGDIFGDLFGNHNFSGMHRGSAEEPRQPGKTYKITVEVGIEEIFKGTTKKFKFDREVRCEHCHGQGGEGVQTCEYCHGSGMITKTQQTAFGYSQTTRPCPYCGGSGKSVKKTCTHCHGTGMKTEKSEIEIKVPMGVENGFSDIIRGKGGDSKNSTGRPGDIIYTVVYNIDTTRYQIMNNAVYELINVPYYDMILGSTITRTLPDGRKVDVKIPKYSKNEDNIVLKHKAYKNKDYVFVLNAIFPSTLSKNEEEYLEKIKKLH